MSTIYPPLSSSVIEGISKALGHTDYGLTGTEIDTFIPQAKLINTSPGITKWKRLYNSFAEYQNRTQNSNSILTFINQTLSPARFIGRESDYHVLRCELNKSLSFAGLELSEKGQFRKVKQSTTISEAEQRANQLRAKLERRNSHSIIYDYCKAELLAENYFHTVFEATKSVAEEIRKKTGLT